MDQTHETPAHSAGPTGLLRRPSPQDDDRLHGSRPRYLQLRLRLWPWCQRDQQDSAWLQECMEKSQRDKKKGKRPSWRNLWLMNTPIYLWFMGRKPWWGLCLDCGRGFEGKPLRRKEMFSMMGARQPGKWMTAPGTCLECAKAPA